MLFSQIMLPAMSYGLSATSIPGPLQAYLLNVTLRYGWRRGLLVVLAPLIVDGPVIILTVVILNGLPDTAIQVIRVLGGLLLLYIAWSAWQQLKSGASFSAGDDDKLETDGSPMRVMLTAVATNIFSPGPYLFWGAINGPLLIEAIELAGVWGAVAMMLSFYGVFLGGMSLLVLLFSRLGTVDERLTRIILSITIGLLIWFGTGLLFEAANAQQLHQTLSVVAILLGAVWFTWRRVIR